MATNNSNGTYINKGHEDRMPFPGSHCIPWFVVFGTECLAIVLLNIITISIFVKQRQLQRRSTYLIIHLAIVDLFVGAVTGPLKIYWMGGILCGLWDYRGADRDITWLNILRLVLGSLFPSASLLNLAVISLERLHATFCPFRHRFMNKWVYGVIITVIWVMSIAVKAAQAFFKINSDSFPVIWIIIVVANFVFLVFVICVSYIFIHLKVRCIRHPQHHGAAGLRERKLTSTLFLVTLGSLLTYLPKITSGSLWIFHSHTISGLTSFKSFMMTDFLQFANSLINPIIYAMRMPEFRVSISQIIFRRAPNRLNPVELPLNNL